MLCRVSRSLSRLLRRRAPVDGLAWCPPHVRMFGAKLPDHVEMTMPALSPTMTKGGIAMWKKKVGDRIMPGDVIAEVETDKALVDFEAQEEGFLAAILVEGGTSDIPVGKAVCIVVDDEESVASFADYSPMENVVGSGGDEEAPVAASDRSKLPPFEELTMPALSPTMTKGTISRWMVKKGDRIKAGEVLAQVDTDKATVDYEALEDGYIARILVAVGASDIPVGTPIAIVVDEDKDIELFHDYVPAAAPSAKKKTSKPASTPATTPPKPAKSAAAAARPSGAPPPPAKPGARVIASPYARKIAAENNVDISQVRGSGPDNRIVAADVEQFVASGGGSGSAGTALSFVGNAEADAVALSKRTIPHYYLTSLVNADAILAAIDTIVGREKDTAQISLREFIVKAAAVSMRDVPEINSRWNDDSIRQFNVVDIAVTVATNGTISTPVVVDADRKGLQQIANDIGAAAATVEPTFAISHLATGGVSQISAIVNPNNSAILAIGDLHQIVVGHDGEYRQSTVFNATLSCDHRVVDGAVGAQWLQSFKRYCEQPISLLL